MKNNIELKLDVLRATLNSKLADYEAINAELEIIEDPQDRQSLVDNKAQLLSDIAIISRKVDKLCTCRVFE